MKAKWAMEREWWYRRTFKLPTAQKGRTFRLVFDGVDYSCDVWLNNAYLGTHEGMGSPFEFDVSSRILVGDDVGQNGFVVRLNPPPRTYRAVAGRKFAWHGDNWRSLTPMSIWQPVRLVAICHFITYVPDFKWGIVDYFQTTIRSFDFVRRAYQPLLVSMQFDKRRWLPGETFAGKLWIVNDLARGFTDCRLKTTISNAQGDVLQHQSAPIEVVAADSSAAVAGVKWNVA